MYKVVIYIFKPKNDLIIKLKKHSGLNSISENAIFSKKQYDKTNLKDKEYAELVKYVFLSQILEIIESENLLSDFVELSELNNFDKFWDTEVYNNELEDIDELKNILNLKQSHVKSNLDVKNRIEKWLLNN